MRGRSRCPRCERKCTRYDRQKPRRWRHPDFGAWEVHLNSRLTRIECSRCRNVVEKVGWTEPESHITLHFDVLVGWLASRCHKIAISSMLRFALRSVCTILERVLARHRTPIDWKAIATDELSFRKGQHYLKLVSDLETGCILWSKDGRSATTLEAFFVEIGAEACVRIRHAVIDMFECFECYEHAIRRCLPNSRIGYDRFHIQQFRFKAVDEVRRGKWHRLFGSDERGISSTSAGR